MGVSPRREGRYTINGRARSSLGLQLRVPELYNGAEEPHKAHFPNRQPVLPFTDETRHLGDSETIMIGIPRSQSKIRSYEEEVCEQGIALDTATDLVLLLTVEVLTSRA